MIKACGTVGSNNPSLGCNLGQQSGYSCYVRAAGAFGGSGKRHVFGMGRDGTLLVNGTGAFGALGVESNEYFTVQRPWYTQR